MSTSAPAYLTPAELPERTGLSERTARRRVAEGAFPQLVISPRIVRVEAWCVDPQAAAPVPSWIPPRLTVRWITRHWRISRRSFFRLVRAGVIRLHREGGRLYWPRDEFVAWVRTHTLGRPVE